MPTSCEIYFENSPMKIVFAGELLCGKVRLTLTKEKHLRSIYIRMRGHASVRLDDPTRGYNSGRQNYLNKAIYLMRGINGEVHLKPGTYNYEFQCMMPSDLPSSVEGSIGHIRYTACVVIDIPWWRSKEYELQFTVIKTIDLNDYPTLRQPVIVSKNKSFFLNGLLCNFSSQLLSIVARIPVRGYIPRQTIHLELYVNNVSGQSITGFKVQLIKQIEYSRRRKECFTITEQNIRGCGANREQLIYVKMLVPSIFPTDMSTMSIKIIQVKHLIRITGSILGCFKNPVLNLPITIGTYPFEDFGATLTTSPFCNSNARLPNAPSNQPNVSICAQPSDRINNSTILYQNTAYRPLEHDSNDGPPTYEETMLSSDIPISHQHSNSLDQMKAKLE